MSNIPEDLSYTAEHEWVSAPNADGVVRVGITDFAQDALGDVVYAQMPEVGTTITANDVVGEVESTKSVSDIYAPVTRRSRGPQRSPGHRFGPDQLRSVRRRLADRDQARRSRRGGVLAQCIRVRTAGRLKLDGHSGRAAGGVVGSQQVAPRRRAALPELPGFSGRHALFAGGTPATNEEESMVGARTEPHR